MACAARVSAGGDEGLRTPDPLRASRCSGPGQNILGRQRLGGVSPGALDQRHTIGTQLDAGQRLDTKRTRAETRVPFAFEAGRAGRT